MRFNQNHIEPKQQETFFGLHPNVFLLGITSLLTDVSSEMIFTLLPLFLANVLGVGATIVGLVGGLSDSIDAGFRIVSGWLSDKFNKRKLPTVLGYSLSTLAKPFMYLTANWGVILSIRVSDRIGKGIRTAPRDALIAALASIAMLGIVTLVKE